MNALSVFNDWLNSDYYGFGRTQNSAFTPAVDVTENNDSYVFDVDLPGRSEKDVNLELNDHVLTISSVKQAEKEVKTESSNEENANANEEETYLIRERRHPDFKRTFSLPKDIDEENVSAGFKNGVLSIRIPRRPEVQPKRMQINIA